MRSPAKILCAVALLNAALLPARAGSPEYLNYQGLLNGADGQPLPTGNYTNEFNIYDQAVGGTKVWGPFLFDGAVGDGHGPVVPVVNGRFNVIIGPLDTLAAPLSSAFASTNRFVEIKVNSGSPILPRQQFLSTPYAFKANNADQAAVATSANVAASVSDANVALLSRNPQTFSGNNNFSGSLGVGAPVQADRLHIASPGGTRIRVESTGASYAGFLLKNAQAEWFTGIDPGVGFGTYEVFQNSPAGGTRLAITTNGIVGIGTATPTRGRLEVANPIVTAYNIGGFLNRNGADNFNNTDFNRNVAIYAASIVVATEFNANSDARIKNIQGRSDGTADLATLNRIEITDYTFKDVIAQGSTMRKKVIGQQVETVYPQAVSTSTNVVPDIYQQATVQDGWVKLATNLKKGERVRLIGKQKEGIHEVLEASPGGFRTDFAADGDTVFVYGREVNDFRAVDYEAIAMLNVSATQELARRLEELERREVRLAELEMKAAQVETLEQELADLKRMVARLAESGAVVERTAFLTPINQPITSGGITQTIR